MKTKILILTLCFGSFLSWSQDGKERSITSFEKIEASGPVKVTYRQSDTLSLKINGEDKDATNVETKVENGILIIDLKGKQDENVMVRVSGPVLKSVSFSGAANFKSLGAVKADTFYIQAAGAGHVKINLDANYVNCNMSGAGNTSIEGKAELFDAVVAGASTLRAYDFICNKVNIDASGASTAKIFVNNSLNAKASGASTIKIKGDAKDISAESTSAASITRIVNNGDSKAGSDSTTIRWKGKKVIIVEGDKDKKKMKIGMDGSWDHWAGFSLGVNGLLTPGGSTSMDKAFKYMDLNYSRSINIQLNFFQHNFHLYKNYVNLVTGFGIEWRRYMLDNKTTLNPDSSFTYGIIDSTNNFSYNKNLFKSTMLQVPLLLEFNTSKKANRSFHIAVGAIGQFMVNSKTKQILETKGDEYTKVRKDTYNMSPLSVKAHASIGYSGFTVFGEYNLTELFDSGEGPKLLPFTAGIRIVPF
ncbi:MAG: DUF2807 domain-containing protein [Sphingobacteriaceae bacterium]|nr:DUF2807 domain-containing protein [Sphingobacteriaceae bacterium]